MSKQPTRDKSKEPAPDEAPRHQKAGGRVKKWRIEYRTPAYRGPRPWRTGWSRSGRNYETEEQARKAFADLTKPSKAWLAWAYRLIGPDGKVEAEHYPKKNIEDRR